MTTFKHGGRPRGRGGKLATHLVLLAAACLMPALLFSVTLLARHVFIERERIESHLLDRARLLAEATDLELDRIRTAAEVLVTSRQIASSNFANFYEQAAQVRDRLGANVVLRDRMGQQIVNVRAPWGTPLPRTVSEVDEKVIATRQPQVSGLVVGGVLASPHLVVVAPVLRDGEITHLLSLTVPPERLNAIIASERLPEGWTATIIDGQGVVIARSRAGEAVMGERIPEQTWEEIRGTMPTIFHRTRSDGSPVLQTYGRSRLSGWVVEIDVPEALVTASAHRTILMFLGGGSVLLLVTLGAAAALGRRLTRPITALAAAATELGAGKPAVMQPSGISEVDVVGQAIREAAERNQQRTAALRASESRLRLEHEFLETLIRQAPVGISIAEAPTGRAVVLNQKAMTLLGHSQSGDGIGRYPAHGALHADGRTYDVDEYPTVRALNRGEVVEREEMVYRRDQGRAIRLEVSSAPVRDATGRIIAAVTVFADVEERRQAEEALRDSERRLRDSEERLRLAVQIGRIGTFDWDIAKDTHLWSPETYSAYGVPADAEITSAWILRMVHPDDAERVRATVAAGLDPAGEGEWSIEHRIIRAGGEVRWLSTSARAIFTGAKGARRAARVIGVVQDITARKTASEALRAERDRARLYLETAEVMLLVVGADRKVQLINRKGAEILGLPAVRIIGSEWFATFVPERVRKQVATLHDYLIEGHADGPMSHENPVRRADGTERIIAWRNAVIRNESGTIIATLSSGEDVTDRRAAEQALLENQGRLRQLQAELLHVSRLTDMGQMAAALAHELNQPLAAVANYIGGCRLLLKDDEIGTERIRGIRDVMGLARDQAVLAGKIIRRLREFLSKGETERRVENAGKVIEDAATLALVGAEQRGIKVALTVGSSEPVLVDRVQIQQVLVNLVRNAVDAMETSPVKTLSIHAVRADGMIEVSVEDTGPGLPQEMSDRLFEPFASTKSQGMGIGLSVCRAIVEGHGGQIWAEPGDTGGTRFHFTIPIVRREEEAHVG